MPDDALLELDIPELTKVKSGKVREVFDLGEHFLFVASDRISAFDVIMPNGIPRKGEVLTQISHFWFDKYADLVPNHRVANGLPDHLAHLASRSMVVKKAEPLHPITTVLKPGCLKFTLLRNTQLTPNHFVTRLGVSGNLNPVDIDLRTLIDLV